MKKIFSFLLLAGMLLGLCACGDSDEKASSSTASIVEKSAESIEEITEQEETITEKSNVEESSIEEPNVEESSFEPVEFYCGEYKFKIESLEASQDDISFNLKCKIRNLSDERIDYAHIWFDVLDENGDKLGSSDSFNAFQPTLLEAGQGAEQDWASLDFTIDDAYGLKLIRYEILRDEDGGEYRTIIAQGDISDQNIYFDLK